MAILLNGDMQMLPVIEHMHIGIDYIVVSHSDLALIILDDFM